MLLDQMNYLFSSIDKPQFSDFIGNYIKELKLIKRPRISNAELFDDSGSHFTQYC